MKKKRIVAFAMAIVMALLVMPILPSIASEPGEPNDVFFDDFSDDELDSAKWIVANKAWGGNNGGVVAENVSVSDGTLKLEGHGLQYKGDVMGVGKRGDGTLVGAAIATREYYASGSYEVIAKIAPDLGACSAMWTFEYEEYYPGQEGYIPEKATYGYCTVNHEIDIEIPTATSREKTINFHSARFNTYRRENEYTSHFDNLDKLDESLGKNKYCLNDGEFHKYRFDWHSGDDGKNEEARVEFYIDDVFQYVSTTNIPNKAGRFWIGVWFPASEDSNGDGVLDSGWAGVANFDTTVFEVDSVKITPFHEASDANQEETYGYDGWAENSFPELAASEAYEHIKNGDFSKGTESWTLEDEAKIGNGFATLFAGNHTDSISQTVDAVPCATYTITADVITPYGTKVKIGACKENGGNDQYTTVDKSGKVSFTFNNETVNNKLCIYAKVERWQGEDAKAVVTNISMKGASYVKSATTDFTPSGVNEFPAGTPSINKNTPTKDPNPGNPTQNPEKPDNGARISIIKNGKFDEGAKDWELSGGAKVADGVAVLQSGNDTDTISQKVDVEKGETYTLSADIKSAGADIEFGVKDNNGRYTRFSEVYTKDGSYQLTFDVASYISQIEVFATVERYQLNKENCSIDNIVLVKGKVAGEYIPPTNNPDDNKPTGTPGGSPTPTGTPSGTPAPTGTPRGATPTPAENPDGTTPTGNPDGDLPTGTPAGEANGTSQTENANVKSSIMLEAKMQGKTTIKLTWPKVSGADQYVIYGNVDGKKSVQVAKVKKNQYTVKKIGSTKLKANKVYDFYVVAYKKGIKTAKSETISYICGNTYKKYANVTKIQTTKSAITLKKGKTSTIKVKATIYKGKKHLPSSYGRATRYYSSNTKVATVSANGKIKAKGKGTATIYVSDISGKYCKVKVKVK